MRISLILLLITACEVNAQNLKVEYQVRFNDLYDRGRSDRLHTGFLLINGDRSRYYTVEKEKYQPKSEHDVMIMPDTANQVYTNLSSGLLFSQETDLRQKIFFVSDSLYPMKWEIGPEEKKIDSMTCIRASCRYRGRDYIAWFASEIPVPYGPWKMGGLPGLIVELQDAEENLVIRLRSVAPSEQRVELPSRVRYSKEEHVADIKKFIARLKENARASATGDCVTCQQQSVIEFFSWEKIPQ